MDFLRMYLSNLPGVQVKANNMPFIIASESYNLGDIRDFAVTRDMRFLYYNVLISLEPAQAGTLVDREGDSFIFSNRTFLFIYIYYITNGKSHFLADML